MKPRTQDELLFHFMNGGCMVDTETGEVYISDVNAEGMFFGIFLSEPVPEDAWHDFDAAVEAAYYETMNEYAAPGCWFDEVAEMVLEFPERYMFEAEVEDMRAYEKFEDKVRQATIDQVPQMTCPRCGKDALHFHESPNETYMADGTFVRNELVWCGNCNLNIEVEQVYKPVKCYVTSFDDTFCEDEEG